MLFQHVYDKSLAQASYFIGCQKAGVAAVIDPKRDVDAYLDIAKANDMKITHIFETHIHADFLSGSRELSYLTGAEIFLSDEGGEDWKYDFPHVGLRDGVNIKLGNLSFDVIHTPGHTPESISFLLTDNPAIDKPVMLFTGDFVFVGDIGRPDLLEKAIGKKGSQEVGAKQMFQSLKRFAGLPDYVQVWPGHGAGSACGKALGSVPSSTIGYEKLRNWAFKYRNNEVDFTWHLLNDQPEAPKYFARMKMLNKMDRPLLTEVPKLNKLPLEIVEQNLANGMTLIDTRDKDVFAKAFVPGSINIQGNNSFATWAGWFLNYENPFMLIADESQLDDLTRKLMRIGLDKIAGYLPAASLSFAKRMANEKVNIISVEEAKRVIQTGDIQLVDLRSRTEFEAGHISNADNVFLGTLLENLDSIDQDKQVVLYCRSGDRSTIAYSILTGQGYTNITNFSGGIKGWTAAGEPLIECDTFNE